MEADPRPITNALEDYLETIYLLVRDRKLARVRDIAAARGVKMGSVTPAMKRLAEMGLIEYTQREYIDLTDEGRRRALKTLSRHKILRRFFSEVLQMSPEAAEADACAMEHHLSNEGMDKMTRLFEFLERCPEDEDDFLERFHQCAAVQPDREACAPEHRRHCRHHRRHNLRLRNLASLKPNETGVITQVNAQGPVRQRLLDMGMLPNTEVTIERFAPTGDPVWVRLQGFQLSLRRVEAESILIRDEEE